MAGEKLQTIPHIMEAAAAAQDIGFFQVIFFTIMSSMH